MGTQNKIIVPIYDMIDEAYVWSWAEVQRETGEWILGSLQHTEKEQQRAQEAGQTLKGAIQEEQAGIQNRSKNEEEVVGKGQAKNRAELGIKKGPRTRRTYRREEEE